MIIEYISSVSYQINLNGETLSTITSTIGIRQKDSLSLYLFAFTIEGLIKLINKLIVSIDIIGIKIGKWTKNFKSSIC